jgi:hypothetical protein
MKHLNQNEINKVIIETKTTLDAINNLVPSDFSKNLKNKYLKNEISNEEVIQIIKKYKEGKYNE